MKTHKTKQGALKAARVALGADSIEGVDFNLHQTGAGWTHEDVPPANAAAEKAQAKRVKAPTDQLLGPKKKARATTVQAAVDEIRKANGYSKAALIMDMLTTAGGATSKEIEEATGWQPHSVRGFLGGLRKKGVAVESKKLPKEPTIYRITAVGDVV